ALRNLIREDKTAQILSVIQTGANLGMQSLDQSLRELFMAGKLSREEGRRRSTNPRLFEPSGPGGGAQIDPAPPRPPPPPARAPPRAPPARGGAAGRRGPRRTSRQEGRPLRIEPRCTHLIRSPGSCRVPLSEAPCASNASPSASRKITSGTAGRFAPLSTRS